MLETIAIYRPAEPKILFKTSCSNHTAFQNLKEISFSKRTSIYIFNEPRSSRLYSGPSFIFGKKFPKELCIICNRSFCETIRD